MKTIMEKIAKLSTYLDKRGYRKESHKLDHAMYSLAQGEQPGWTSPIERIRWEIENSGGRSRDTLSQEGQKMFDQLNEEDKKELGLPEHDVAVTHKEPQPHTGEDASGYEEGEAASANFVVIEMQGYEPIKVNLVSQIAKLVEHPNVSEAALIKSIYDSVYQDSGEIQLGRGATLQDAIKMGIQAKVLVDDRHFWQK